MARVAVLGASGYAGAIAAMLVHRHPFFELAHVTARSEAGARLDDLHPRTRVPLELEQWDPEVQSDVEAALVCWPHRVAAPAVAALRERGVRVVDLSADFRLSDRGIYEDWYGEHGAPALFGQGVYGLPELHRERIARRRPRRQPRLLPDRGAARARAARARRADRRRRDRRQVRRLRRRPRADREHALRLGRREPDALQGRAPPPHAGDRAGARRPGRGGHDHVHAAPGPARPGRARLLLRHAGARAHRGRGARAVRRGLRARAVRRAAARRARHARTCARRTSAACRCIATRARAGSSRSRRSTTSGREPRRRPSRTST